MQNVLNATIDLNIFLMLFSRQEQKQKKSMFRKIISNLPYSPALVGQLGFYAQRLKKEQVTRQLGLVFTILALLVQSFALIHPPESANAAGYRDCSHNSIINCGAQSVSELQQKYRQNAPGDLHAIYNDYGITSSMISAGVVKVGYAMKNGDVVVNDKVVATDNESLGRDNLSGSHRRVINGKTYYESPSQTVFLSNSITIYAFMKSDGTFIGGIMLSCGNPVSAKPKPPVKPKPTPTAICSNLQIAVIDRTHFRLTGSSQASGGAVIDSYSFSVANSKKKVVYSDKIASHALSARTPTFALTSAGKYSASVTVATSVGSRSGGDCVKALTVAAPQMCALNPSLPANSPDCRPCAGDSTIWYKDTNCTPNITHTKSAFNMTQNADATKVVAQPGDLIKYTIDVVNSGKAAATQDVVDQLSDVLEYSSVQDTGGGAYDSSAKALSFSGVTVPAGSTFKRSFVVQVANDIPSTPQGTTNPGSFDCTMTNVFGTTTDVKVNCPPEKVVEQTVSSLPSTGPGENIIFGTITLMVVTYFYARARQMNKEVRLVRHDYNVGTI